jgi:hypothetical protein
VPTTDQRLALLTTQDAAIVRRGTLTFGALRVSYFTSNPAPTQWVAVGVDAGTRMLTGAGSSERAALTALCARYEQASDLSS